MEGNKVSNSPENRRKSGRRGKDKGKRRMAAESLANLEKGTPSQFQPGQSANPGGRPKTKRITEAYNKILDEAIGENEANLELKADDTGERGAAKSSLREWLKGNSAFAKEMADRVEGRVAEKQEIEATVSTLVELPEILNRARKRAQRKESCGGEQSYSEQ